MNAMNMSGQIVLIGVCTHRRPQMLRDCLDSLTQQLIPPNISAAIVVVDNELTPAANTIVDEFAPISPIPIYYVHEPRRGIACARNAVLDTAKSMCADWIAFIDDDETAEPDWLVNLMAPEYFGTPILMGWQRMTYPEPRPFWSIPKIEKMPKEGVLRKTAYGNNVRISMSMVTAGMRFDETLGLMGGEDNELFSAACVAGFEIRATAKAITHEIAHPERLTYCAQIYRAYWCGAADLRMHAIKNGWTWALTRKTHTIPLNMAFGIVELLVAPIFTIAGANVFKRRLLEGGKKIAKAMGRMAAFFNTLPQPYRHTVGH